MVTQQILESLLRIQAASNEARIAIAGMTQIPAVKRLVSEITALEQQLAQSLAAGLGYTPMATGGLVTSPTFALLGEAGPEMVIPVRKKKRKVSKYQRELGRQIKSLESQKRLRNGSYRSGWNRSKIMSKAHKLTRKQLGMR